MADIIALVKACNDVTYLDISIPVSETTQVRISFGHKVPTLAEQFQYPPTDEKPTQPSIAATTTIDDMMITDPLDYERMMLSEQE